MQLGQTKQSQAIRGFLIDAVRSDKKNVVGDTCDHFSISRQAVNRHLIYLAEKGFLESVGATRGRVYRLGPVRQQIQTYALSAITEDRVYANDFAFAIFSGDLVFSHLPGRNRDIMNHAKYELAGTRVCMSIALTAEHTLASVFDEYTDADTLDFSKTVVPVRLALYEGQELVSRSQAKRIMNRVERFRNVMLDFEGVDTVGRSFVDEIFRVFALRHPEVTVRPINMNPAVHKEVARVAGPDEAP